MYHALAVTLNWWNSNQRCKTPAVKDPSSAPTSNRYERMFGMCQGLGVRHRAGQLIGMKPSSMLAHHSPAADFQQDFALGP
jgi:hypothetical protein